jgi:hypothetical protein
VPRFAVSVIPLHAEVEPQRWVTDLTDLAAAKQESLRASHELLSILSIEGWDGALCRLEVRAEEGQALFALHFSAEDASSPAGAEPE